MLISTAKGKAILASVLATTTLPILLASAECLPDGDQTAINEAFKKGGPGTIVDLCSYGIYKITAPIVFTHDGQALISDNPNDFLAKIRVAPGTTFATIIKSKNLSNITLRNLAIYGDRTSLGVIKDGGGAIELGGSGSNFNVSRVACQEPRGHSCVHFTGGDNCRNGFVEESIFNVILDADAIRLNCRDSQVHDTKIQGFTGFGINVLGASGSHIHNNTFISASRAPAKAGIALVDTTFDYDGVRVYNNYIRGSKLLHVGIAIGSDVFDSNNSQSFGQGPVDITGNDADGRVGFLMAINGWANGINAGAFENGYYASKRALSKEFVDIKDCDPFVKDAIVQSTNYTYWKDGIQGGPTSLAKGFYAMKGDGRNFSCMKHIPGIRTYKRGEIDVASKPSHYLCDFSSVSTGWNQHGVFHINRVDGSLGFPGVRCETDICRLKFGQDGNFVQVDSTGAIVWSSKTAGKGEILECLGERPYLRVRDAAGKEIWNAGLLDDEI